MRVGRIVPIAVIVIGMLVSPSASLAVAGETGNASILIARSVSQIRQHLSMTPRCLVARRRVSAHVTLTHAGPHARVEFIWAPKHGISLGPGYGPGIFRSDTSGIVKFSAVPPSKYGNGTTGKWILAAEWPKAAHAFVRVSFNIVAHMSDCEVLSKQ